MKKITVPERGNLENPKMRHWRTFKPVAFIAVVGIAATAYLKASLFVPRIGDDAAETTFDDLDREILQDINSIAESQDASNINIDFGSQKVDAKFALSLAHIAYRAAKIRAQATTSKLNTDRLDLIEDIAEMIDDLGDCGEDHDCKDIEKAMQDNSSATQDIERHGRELIAIHNRVHDFLVPLDHRPSVKEHVEFLIFLTNAIRKPETLVKDWHGKPAFSDIAKLQDSTARLLRIHRDLYREYTSRRRLREALASMFSRSG